MLIPHLCLFLISLSLILTTCSDGQQRQQREVVIDIQPAPCKPGGVCIDDQLDLLLVPLLLALLLLFLYLYLFIPRPLIIGDISLLLNGEISRLNVIVVTVGLPRPSRAMDA